MNAHLIESNYDLKVMNMRLLDEHFGTEIYLIKVGETNSTQLVKGTFQMAYTNRKPILPLTFHTDRGSNYQSKTFRLTLQSLGVTQSFSRAHIPYDNSVMHSFPI